MTDEIDRLIDINELSLFLGVSISSIERMQKNDAEFPKLIKLSSRIRRWSLSDIKKYIEQKK